MTGPRARVWSAAMPTPPESNNKDKAPAGRPTTAQKAPCSEVSEKGGNKKKAREARLADALRDNLRRRKAGDKKSKDD